MRLERTTQRTYDNDARAAARATRDKEREQARADRERERNAAAYERQQIKLTEASVAAVAKAQGEKLKIEERWARESLKYAHATSLAKQKILEKELADEMRAREKHARAIGSMLHTSMGSALSRSTRTLANGATAFAGTALGLGGGLSIQGILEDRKALERQAALFSNQTSTSAGGRMSTASIMAQAKAIGLANNVKALDVVGGMNAYFAKTGDAAGSAKNASLFAQLSATTGSSLEEIGAVAGQLRIQNPNLDERAMRAMMLTIVGQSRTGAVDMKDLVSHVATITATSALYGGNQAENQRKLIGLSQAAMRTSGSPAEAATAVTNLAQDVATHAGKIKAAGFDIKDKNGQLKDPAEIIAKLMEMSGGDIGKLKDFGIGRRSLKLFEAESQTFQAAGGGKAGAEAIRKDIAGFVNAGYSEESFQSDLANTLNTTGAKFDKTVERIKQSIEEKLAPHLEHFADKFSEYEPKIEKFVEGIASAADFLMEHPFTSIFALMSANIAGEIAKAGISKAIQSGLERALVAGASKGISINGVAGGIAIAAAAVALTTMGMEQIDASLAKGAERRQQGINTELEATNLIGKLKSGKGTAEDKARAQELMKKLKSERSAAMNASTGESDDITTKLLGGLLTVTGNKSAVQEMHSRDAQRFQSLTDSMNKLAKVLEQQGGNGAPAAPNRITSLSNRPTGAQ